MLKNKCKLDERQKNVVQRIFSIMYILTIFSLDGILIFRQYFLNQPVSEYEEIAILLTVNVLVVIAAFLYFVGFPFKKVRLLNMSAIYCAFVIIGTLFTIWFQKLDEWTIILIKFGRIAAICAILGLIYYLFAYLGQRRTDGEES